MTHLTIVKNACHLQKKAIPKENEIKDTKFSKRKCEFIIIQYNTIQSNFRNKLDKYTYHVRFCLVVFNQIVVCSLSCLVTCAMFLIIEQRETIVHHYVSINITNRHCFYK